jgi:hypothetical protein
MLSGLRARLREWWASPLAKWSVRIEGESIVTSDGSRASLQLPIAALRKVVVQTDDSGPWGADVIFFLFTSSPEPAGVFPLEAQGCHAFVKWLGELPGYNGRELARAMGSTDVAQFVVFEAAN